MQDSKRFVQDLLFKEECYKIIGICMKIHAILGKGFKEIVYKDAMEVEFKKANILYEREKRFNIQYEDIILTHKFHGDFLVFESIILEVKASYELRADNFKQTLNFLKSAQVKLGLLINFGEDKLNFKRVICSY
jgi:GxxExxY protein